MGGDAFTDLEAFVRYVKQKVANRLVALTPEQCLALYRAEHPTPQQLGMRVEAVQEALAAMDAGDHGLPLDEFDREFRRLNNIRCDAGRGA